MVVKRSATEATPIFWSISSRSAWVLRMYGKVATSIVEPRVADAGASDAVSTRVCDAGLNGSMSLRGDLLLVLFGRHQLVVVGVRGHLDLDHPTLAVRIAGDERRVFFERIIASD